MVPQNISVTYVTLVPYQSVTHDVMSEDRRIGIPTKRPWILPLPVSRGDLLCRYFLTQVRAPIGRSVTAYGRLKVIVTLLEVAGSLPGTRALRLNRGNTHMGSERSLHMEPSSLPVLRDSSSEGLAPDAPPHPAAEGMEEPNRVYSWTLWSSF